MSENAQDIAAVLKDVAQFTSRALAFAYANRAAKTLWVMLGDNGRYWVTTPANCARLERMGYEWAE